MKKSKFLNSILLSVLSVFLISACYNDNEEDLYPQQVTCDTSNVTYSITILPVIQGNCNVCHSSASPSGGVITDNYTGLSIVALNGKLWGTINWDQGYSHMPQYSSKLSDCNLKKIKIWIDAGAPNN